MRGADQRHERRVASAVVVVASVVMLLMVTSGRPWNLFATGAFTSDFYDAQAHSFAHGHLDVDPAVASIEGIEVGDRIHLYYGVFLSLIRLPLAVFTNGLAGQLTRLSILVAYVLSLVVAIRLAVVAKALVKAPSAGTDRWRIATFVAAIAVSPMLFAGGWITVYHETEVWAFALALTALTMAMEFVESASPRWAYLAAAAASLCTMTRASVGLGVTAAVAVAVLLTTRRNPFAAVGTILVGGVGIAIHAAVNWMRFGSLFDVPFRDQVATRIDPARAEFMAEHGGSLFSWEYLPSALLQYARPDSIRIERLVPFVRFGPLAKTVDGVEFESNTPASSLTATATLLLVLAALGTVLLVRRRRWNPIAVSAVALIGAVPTLTIAFIANRYLIDLLPPLVVLAACGVWTQVRRPAIVRPAVAVLVAWGALANVALGLWVGQLERPGFTEARYRLDGALPAPSPGLSVLTGGRRPDHYGAVAVDLEADEVCHGVYIAGYGGWLALERTPGDREMTGAAPIGRASRLVANDVWALDMTAGGDVVYTIGDTDSVIATVDVVGTDDTTVDYRLVVDPVTEERWLDIGGEFAYLPASAFASGQVERGAHPSGRLCTLLVDRL